MLTADAGAAPRYAPLERLGAARARAFQPPVDWDAPIDRSRWFLCETLTPLFYTSVYSELDPDVRRRYNQLTGLFAAELILLLETEFLATTLRALEDCQDSSLRAAAADFADDEIRHSAIWRRLLRLSAPDRYTQSDRWLCEVPPVLARLSKLVARYPAAVPVTLWIQLAQEERSIDISRRSLRLDANLEPRYAAVYREHLHDEVRHVQIDCHLLERYYAPRAAGVRRTTAWLLRRLLGSVFLRPVRSTLRVVRALADERPAVRPLLGRIRLELDALPANPEYQRMMYSRRTTPLLFAWFDRCPEFHTVGRVLSSYSPPPPRGAP